MRSTRRAVEHAPARGGRGNHIRGRADIVLVHHVGFEVAGDPAGDSGLRSAALFGGIVDSLNALATPKPRCRARSARRSGSSGFCFERARLRSESHRRRSAGRDRARSAVRRISVADPPRAPPRVQVEQQLACQVGRGLAIAEVSHRSPAPLNRSDAAARALANETPSAMRRGQRDSCSPNVIWSVPIDSRATLEIISSIMTIRAW